jgi:hypothetical protein
MAFAYLYPLKHLKKIMTRLIEISKYDRKSGSTLLCFSHFRYMKQSGINPSYRPHKQSGINPSYRPHTSAI